ncbi:MAG TPA: ATP-binding protein, partial [Myxococcota bacterium]|nr:ATP-binding protein [Myxococcota bacterium]
NNLLAVILGNLEAAEARSEDREDLSSLLRDATDAAVRGAALTQRLLALSRKQALKPEPIDPGELVAGMSNLLERSLGAPVAVQITRADDVRPCIADPTQLESTLLNLAINARDAMPDGGVIAIEVANAEIDAAYAKDHPSVQPGSYVEIRVRDTGVGIDPAILPRVFDPFFTTKEVGAGTGLGLSMVYGFARQSRGHVTIRSEVGRGTEVRLYLPACPERSPFSVDRERDETPRGRGESILVVEDQPAVRRLVGRLLEDLGYRVCSAADGADALRLLAELGCVDLLLSDVVLPGEISGRDLAFEARRRQLTLSALLMSGYAPDADADARAPEAAASLLHKPFRRSELARHVRAALDARASI